MGKKSTLLALYQNMLLLATGCHIITIFASYFLIHDTFLVIQNLVSFSIYLILQIYWKIKNDSSQVFLMIFIVVMELLVQITISGFYLGWEAGFQNFCFITFTISFLNIFEKSKGHSLLHFRLIHVASIFLYVLISLRSHFYEPIKVLPKSQLELINQINAVAIFAIGIYLANIFSKGYKHSIRKLKLEAEFDELTKLSNRHAIRERLDEVRTEYNEAGINYAICIIDIDDFKQINDSFGHNTGDEVLVEIGRVLQSIESDKTSCCRWGGEEFLIIDQYGDFKENFISKINILRNSIEELDFSFPEKNIFFHITVTAGCAFSDNTTSVHELIDKADNRLYWGKRNGKNVTIFSDN